MLPTRAWVEGRPAVIHPAPQIVQVSQRLGIPTLDASDVLRDAVVRGEPVFLEAPGDPHLSPAGNELLAEWLHEHLPDSRATLEGEPWRAARPARTAGSARPSTALRTGLALQGTLRYAVSAP